MKFTIPVKTRNPLNGSQGRTRGAMLGAAARRKKERNTAKLCCLAAYAPSTWPILQPYGTWLPIVTLTRLSAGKLDTDGLAASLKSCRDGIADALGTADSAAGPQWIYSQRKSKRGEYGVEVEIT